MPDSFTLQAVLGVDGAARTLHAWTIDGTEYQPWVAIVMYDAAQTASCTFYLQFDNPQSVSLQHWEFEDATPEAAGQAMDHWGFVVPEDARIGLSDGCADWNPDVYGEIVDVVPDRAWAFGIGDLRVDIAAVIEGDGWADSWPRTRLDAGELIGGSWSSDMWEPSTFASHYATGSPTAEWVLELDGDGYPLDYYDEQDYAREVDALPDGVYLLGSVYLWSFETYFGAR